LVEEQIKQPTFPITYLLVPDVGIERPVAARLYVGDEPVGVHGVERLYDVPL
jgi:hypothetical protein